MIPPEPDPKKVELAMRLLRLGVSNAGVTELLAYDPELIERQLDLLPYRRAKRPSAFIVDAIRNNYAPPANHPSYASSQNDLRQATLRLDQNSEQAH